MSSRISRSSKVSILLYALAIPLGVAAEPQADQPTHHHYKLIDTGTLGGSFSSLGFEGERGINNGGAVVSLAETTIPDPVCFNGPDCLVAHAVLWRNGTLSDLGALEPGYNSGPIAITDSGLVAGFSFNGLLDPLTGFPEFQAVLFTKNGHVLNLGGFGGNQSTAFGINNRGDIVGCATNPVPDAFGFCIGGLQQSRAFLWRDGKIMDLGTLGGPDALAELVNDRGQVVGWSLTDSVVNPATGIPTQHPFLWEHGTMRDLGTIGGTAIPEINHISNRGEVVGAMNTAGDQAYHPFLWDGRALRDLGTLGGDLGSAIWTSDTGEVVGRAWTAGNQAEHAFLWQAGAVTDLGTVDGDPNSVAFSVNSKGQVVGSSRDVNFFYAHAFLWERGSIADLNALVSSDSRVQLMAAVGINERGEIAAQGMLLNGDLHAFLLIPCDQDHPDIEGCDYGAMEGTAVPANHAQAAAAGQERLTPHEVSRIRALLLQRSRGSMAVTIGNDRPGASISAPSVTLSPTSLTFSQAIGATSAAQTVTLNNIGTTTLTISGITIAGANAGDFAQTHTCGSSLAAGGSCPISVTFRPTAGGTRTAALSVADNAAGSPQKVSFTGIGTTAILAPSSLNFGQVQLGITAWPQPVTLTNRGTTSLTISAIGISGTNAGDFSQTHACGSSLAAGASCSIWVRFRPLALGTRLAALSVTDNGAGSPQRTALSGVGVYLPRCGTRGQQCPPHNPAFPACCPGLRCVSAGTRAFCE